MKRFRTLAIVVLLILLVTVFEKTESRPLAYNLKKNRATISVSGDVFKNISLEAKAAYVFDARTGAVLYAQNENVPLPLASLSKLMTVLVALDSMPTSSVISIAARALEEEGDSGLLAGEKWTLWNLAQFTLTTSSNDGASAIASAIAPLLATDESGDQGFIKAMNLKARLLNLESIHFFNETGLDLNILSAGGYGSAKDVTVLVRHIWGRYPALMETTSYIAPEVFSFSGIHKILNSNREVDKIPGILLSKTGFTDIAGGNLTVAFDAGIGRPIFITVLGSTLEGRFADAQKLVSLSIEAVKKEDFAQ